MSFDSRLLSGIGVVAAVVEAGSFARAGEAMGLTQPAVSRAVARLEERVGIRIFNRTARAISLTDEGRLFYESVAPLLAGIEEAAVSAGKSKAIVRGRLRVNVDGTFGHYVLAPRLGEFLDHYAELAIEISVRDAMAKPRNATPVLAIKSSIAIEPVTKPAWSANGEPRPSAVIETTRLISCSFRIAAAGRVKST